MKKIAIIGLIVLAIAALRIDEMSAVPVKTTWTGTTLIAPGGNNFNLDVGDTIFGHAYWDDEQITGIGAETVEFGDPTVDDGVSFPDNMMQWTIGGFSWEHTDDVDWDTGFHPNIDFVDGNIVEINFSAEVVILTIPDDQVDRFFGTDGQVWSAFFDQRAIGGIASTVSGVIDGWHTEPIPEPATIALLGIGLVGLAGGAIRRRFRGKAKP